MYFNIPNPGPCPTCGRCPTCGQYRPQLQPYVTTSGGTDSQAAQKAMQQAFKQYEHLQSTGAHPSTDRGL